MHKTTHRVTREHTAKAYEFWFDPLGWAFAIVCDATGTLAINSDWGDFQHCWLARAFGEVPLDPLPDDWRPPMPTTRKATLTDFLAGMDDVGYVVDKLTQHDRRRFTVVDQHATCKAIRERIVERRREHIYTYQAKGALDGARRIAREAWRAAQEFCDDLAPSGDNFWEVYERHTEIHPYLSDDEPYEILERRDTRNIDTLATLLLPTLIKHLRGEPLPRAELAAAAP